MILSGIDVDASVLESATIYKISAELHSRTPIAYPEQEVINNEDIQTEIKAKAGISSETIFVSAILVNQKYIGADYYYKFIITMEPTAPIATGHTHHPDTLFHPLQNAYNDGPSIVVDPTLGPVAISAAEAGTVDYLSISQGSTNYMLIDSDGVLSLSMHTLFKNDTVYDIGSADDGATLYRPRDIYIGRDSYTANVGYFGTSAMSPFYEFFQSTDNPDADAGQRHIYWNSTDNRLHVWDGTTDYPLSPGGGGISTWDELYALDKSLSIGSAALTFSTVYNDTNPKFIVNRTQGTGEALKVESTVASGDALNVVTVGGIPVSIEQNGSGSPFFEIVGNKGAGTTPSISEDSEPTAVMMKANVGTTLGVGEYWIPAYASPTLPSGGGDVEVTYSTVGASVGDLVAIHSTNRVEPASATPAGLSFPIGFCVAIPSPGIATVRLAGESVTGGALTSGQTYFMSKTAGQVTNSLAGFTTGDTVQTVGISRNSTTISIQFGPAYVL